MGKIYNLKCEICGEKQVLRSSGGMLYRQQDHKTLLISKLSEKAKDELESLEELYEISSRNVSSVVTSFGKCVECKLLRHIHSFKIKLSATFELSNSNIYFCRNCKKDTRDAFDYSASNFEDSLCPKCDHIGLKIGRSFIYD